MLGSPARVDLDRVGVTWRIFRSTHEPTSDTYRDLSCKRGLKIFDGQNHDEPLQNFSKLQLKLLEIISQYITYITCILHV